MDSAFIPAIELPSQTISSDILSDSARHQQADSTTEKTFNTASAQIVFQEMPNHIALSFTVYGCPFACTGCHSEDTWPANEGQPLTDQAFTEQLERYQGLISAVVFFGGEWQPQELARKLVIAQAQGLATCLYSGSEHITRTLRQSLDFVKLGPWKSALGGLDSATTNQRFYELKDGELWQDRSHWFRS